MPNSDFIFFFHLPDDCQFQIFLFYFQMVVTFTEFGKNTARMGNYWLNMLMPCTTLQQTIGLSYLKPGSLGAKRWLLISFLRVGCSEPSRRKNDENFTSLRERILSKLALMRIPFSNMLLPFLILHQEIKWTTQVWSLVECRINVILWTLCKYKYPSYFSLREFSIIPDIACVQITSRRIINLLTIFCLPIPHLIFSTEKNIFSENNKLKLSDKKIFIHFKQECIHWILNPKLFTIYTCG